MEADMKNAIEFMLQATAHPTTSTRSDITELLEGPCRTVEELEHLCSQLKDAEFHKKCAEDGGLPLQDIEELKNIEMQLGNVEFKNKLVSKLSLAGGQTLKKTVWRICGKVFAPQLAVHLNWCGRGDKTAMRNTNIIGVIIQSALRNPLVSTPNEAEAEKTIKEWLRLSRDRLTRRVR